MVAATGDLAILDELYDEVIVPNEVCQEMEAGGKTNFATHQFRRAAFLKKLKKPANILAPLVNSLDLGEASVIQTAIDRKIDLVCIDEAVGRRVARLWGLNVTGSIGILIRAKKLGYIESVKACIESMRAKGIWVSEKVTKVALREAGEEHM